MGKRVFISYLNDDNRKIEGYFELIEQGDNFIKFRTPTAFITISLNRLLKLKEDVKNDF